VENARQSDFDVRDSLVTRVGAVLLKVDPNIGHRARTNAADADLRKESSEEEWAFVEGVAEGEGERVFVVAKQAERRVYGTVVCEEAR
jgi:hypothetical protein